MNDRTYTNAVETFEQLVAASMGANDQLLRSAEMFAHLAIAAKSICLIYGAANPDALTAEQLRVIELAESDYVDAMGAAMAMARELDDER